MLGVGTLRDLALIQLIGVVEGVFSSLFLATPLLVSLVERKKKYQQHNQSVVAYRRGEVLDDDTAEPTEKKRTVSAPAAGESSTSHSYPGDVPQSSATWRPTAR